jgi:hypothetical protein
MALLFTMIFMNSHASSEFFVFEKYFMYFAFYIHKILQFFNMILFKNFLKIYKKTYGLLEIL